VEALKRNVVGLFERLAPLAQVPAELVTAAMNIDDPARRASRRLFETAYTKSPYRFTVIGYPDIFHEAKHEDLLAYYHEKYSPNNVFYVVAGDVRPGEVVAQIRQAYAKTKARAIPPAVLPEEPPQTAPRDVLEATKVAGDAEATHRFRVPVRQQSEVEIERLHP